MKIKINSKKIIGILLLISVFLPLFSLQTSAVSRNIGIGATYDDSLSSYSPANQYYFDIMQTANIHVRLEFASNARANAWRVSIYREGATSPLQSKDFGGDSSSSAAMRTEYTDRISLSPGRY